MIVVGTSKIETTSNNNTELVNYMGKNNNYTSPASFKTISFIAKTDCTVRVNDSEDIFIPKDGGLNFDTGEIQSFVINEQGIDYIYVATI